MWICGECIYFSWEVLQEAREFSEVSPWSRIIAPSRRALMFWLRFQKGGIVFVLFVIASFRTVVHSSKNTIALGIYPESASLFLAMGNQSVRL